MSRPLAISVGLVWSALSVGLIACAPTTDLGGTAPSDEIAPDLVGTNWDGTPYSLDDAAGQVAVVFFGYTYCPDVCPLALAKMKQVEAALGDEADQLEVVFVSVDPHRDTIEKMAAYVPNFDSSFKGLVLDAGQMEAATDSFGVTVQFSQPQDGPGTDSFYYVDHTGTYFLIDRDGSVATTYPPNATADEIAPDVKKLLAS